jgi:dienelactone hydrolase
MAHFLPNHLDARHFQPDGSVAGEVRRSSQPKGGRSMKIPRISFRKAIALCALPLLAAAPVSGAGRSVPYAVDGAPYEGYYAATRAGAPLILMIHDWDGLNAYEVKRAEMLAEMGYAVFAADLFGQGVRPEKMEERRRLTDALYQDRAKMRALMAGALRAAGEQGADAAKGVAVGYCFGGAAVLELARSGADLKGFVSFHGGLTTPEGQNYAKTKGRVLVLHGSADSAVTMEHFATLAMEMEAKGVPHEMITYSGAPHAFTVFGTERYREDADRKSWQRFTAFLGEVLK